LLWRNSKPIFSGWCVSSLFVILRGFVF
jgi:hypothetical protein